MGLGIGQAGFFLSLHGVPRALTNTDGGYLAAGMTLLLGCALGKGLRKAGLELPLDTVPEALRPARSVETVAKRVPDALVRPHRAR